MKQYFSEAKGSFNRTVKKIACVTALSLLGVAGQATTAHAAESVELKVIGTITPDACVPTLSGGGVVDFGKILASSLATSTNTLLTPKEMSLVITCDSALKSGVKFIDNRASSVMTGLAVSHNFGLGKAGTTNIGGYTLYFDKNTTSDGGATSGIVSVDGGSTWVVGPDSDSGSGVVPVASVVSVSPLGTLTPTAYKSTTYKFKVMPNINKASELPMTNQINLDGSMTIEMAYL